MARKSSKEMNGDCIFFLAPIFLVRCINVHVAAEVHKSPITISSAKLKIHIIILIAVQGGVLQM